MSVEGLHPPKEDGAPVPQCHAFGPSHQGAAHSQGLWQSCASGREIQVRSLIDYYFLNLQFLLPITFRNYMGSLRAPPAQLLPLIEDRKYRIKVLSSRVN